MNDDNFIIWKYYNVLGSVFIRFLEQLLMALFESILQEFLSEDLALFVHTVKRTKKEHSGLFWDYFQNLLIYSEAISFQKVGETSAFSNRDRVAGTCKSHLEHAARKMGTADWMSHINNSFWRKVLEINVFEIGTWNYYFLSVIVEVVLSRQRKYWILDFQCVKDHDKCKKGECPVRFQFALLVRQSQNVVPIKFIWKCCIYTSYRCSLFWLFSPKT